MSDSAPAPAKKKLSGPEMLIVFLSGIASYLDAAIAVSMGVCLPIWTSAFHLTPLTLGFINTSIGLSTAFGSLVGGWIADRFGRIRVFNLDILILAIGALIVAFSQNIVMLYIGLFISGLAAGADLPTSLAIITDRVSRRSFGSAITITGLFWTTGILLSQLLGAITGNMGMVTATILFGFVAAVGFVNWLIRVFSSKVKTTEERLYQLYNRTQEPSASDSKKTTKVPLGVLAKQKRYLIPLIALVFFYFCWGQPAGAFGTLLNYFLVTVDHVANATASLVALIGQILGFIMGLVYVRVADTKARYPLMITGACLTIAAFTLSLIFSKIWLVFAVSYSVFCIACVLCGEQHYKMWTQLFFPEKLRATVTGLTLGIVRIGSALFGFVTPSIMTYSADVFFMVMIGFAVVTFVAVLIIIHLVRHFKINDPAMPSNNASQMSTPDSVSDAN